MVVFENQVALPHLLSMEDLTNEEILALVHRAKEFKEQASTASSPLKKQTFVANLFFEPSTRTHKSFEVAEKRLGLEVIEFDAKTSSVNKGETLYDTVKTLEAIGVSVCVIRHSEDAYYKKLLEAGQLTVSLVNGGDGSGQHPSQCLLDLVTISQEFGHFDGLKVAIVGDISHSRVAKSNMEVLKRLGAQVYFSGPKEWYDAATCDAYGLYLPYDELIDQVDVLMLLRVQHERHDGSEAFSKEDYHANYGLTQERYARLKDSAIIMHPAPVNRDVEIADSLVESPKSRIYQQMRNGVYTRMAILEAILRYRKDLH
ncbi:aspartate carbamoyltransferase catalytic subunit [Streptococcus sp. DD12]|uniref:aspartate carbamoyltransferase catalytic subunit n=1 Tax=Streptococcus sp. DD12 TaxID=1777880 RepID=UPI0007981EFF|nr:aspartate carbamoyltransferase catalytic subunit [Streptococcus sp. DD12]KXT76731.1 Aspartate carbamoyltransferase [Streptococcus sp. DD12]